MESTLKSREKKQNIKNKLLKIGALCDFFSKSEFREDKTNSAI